MDEGATLAASMVACAGLVAGLATGICRNAVTGAVIGRAVFDRAVTVLREALTALAWCMTYEHALACGPNSRRL